MAKFLIIRFSSIGDIVLTTPVVRCLKTQVPDAEVHFLTKQSFKSILAHNPYIDQLHLVNDDLGETIRQLQAIHFDYVIDLHHNLRSLRVKRGLQVKSFSFNKLNIEKWLLTNLKINRMPAVHIVDRYLQTLSSLGVLNDGKGLDYFISKSDHVPTSDIPTSHSAGYVGLVIGAALATKKLPLDKLKEICAAINHPIILLGGPEDKAEGDQIAAIDPIKIYNACGKFKLNESADLVRKAKLIITHDTGLMHVAAAYQKPIITIWGNTVPSLGMGPYYGTQPGLQHSFEVAGLRCRPCSKIGYATCPKGHFKCMNQQQVPAIVATAHQMLGQL
ncbi:glycosyltransferase family 9 protein [Phnomibacter sp. MR]|uniref:glycosyltransferase family 9 protein n=1 Tax=Phnomibacter sp. MR TaxID=3042318 RepID=UPI003A81073E